MKQLFVLALSLTLFAGCKEKSEEVKIDEVNVESPADSIIQQDTVVSLPVEEKAADAATVADNKNEVAVNTANAKVSYASFGSKFSEKNVLTQEQMMKRYATLKKGDTISVKFKSKIKDVCKKKGCWMKMDLADSKESFVRFKDYGFFVPLNADNSDAIVSGRAFIDVISVDELKHYAKDGGKSQEEIDKISAPKVTYAFEADGVMIQK